MTDVAFVAGAPGRPAVLRVTTTVGSSDVRLTDVRARLGLKSTGFRLGTLRLDGPAAAARANAALRLTGLARDIEDVVLERRAGVGTWIKVRQLRPAADGTFAVTLRLDDTTAFRLSAGGLAGPALTVRIKA